MATAYTDQVQKVYIAYYGRAADPVGLAYWAAKVEADGLDGIMASFGASAEATTLYGSLTNTAKVNALFQQSFGRDADFAGLMYYAGQLTAGTMTAVTIAQNIFDGASGTDATILANKLVVAKAYTAAVDTAAEVVAYSGTVAAASARTMLSTVDADTVTASFDVATSVASVVASAASPAAGSGSTVNLTVGMDTIAGTTGADAIYGVLTGTASTTTLEAFDTIDGGAGADLLDISLSGANFDGDTTISNVETIKVKATGGARTFDADSITGLTLLQSKQGSQNLTVTNLEATTTELGLFKDSTVNTTSVTYKNAALAGTADNVTLNLERVSAAENVTLLSSGTNDIETVTLNSTGIVTNKIGTLIVDDSGTANTMTKLVIKGDAALTVSNALQFAAASTPTVDASAATGALTLDVDTDLVSTITTGSGADSLDFGNSLTSTDIVDSGAGIDTVIVDSLANGDSVTLNTTYSLTNVEKVSIEGATGTASTGVDLSVDATQVGLTDLILVESQAEATGTAAEAGDFTVTNLAAGVGVTLVSNKIDATNTAQFSQIDTVSLTLADATGTADNITVTLQGTSGSSAIENKIIDLSVLNVETLSIVSSHALTTALTATDDNTIADISSDTTLTTIVLTGSDPLNITLGGEMTNLALVDGSAATDDLTIVTSGLISGTTYKSGSGDDVFTVGARLGETDSFDGGAHGAVATSGDVLTATITGNTAASDAFTIANVETVEWTNTGSAFVDAAAITGATSLQAAGNATKLTYSNLGSDHSVGLGHKDEAGAANAGTTAIALADATGTADSVDVWGYEVAAHTLTATGIESVNIKASTTDTTITNSTYTISALNATTVNLSGATADVGHTLGLGTLDTDTVTMDASAYRGILTVQGSASATSFTAHGTAVADITGGTGADTITVGSTAAQQNLDGGAGTDTANITLSGVAEANDLVNIEVYNLTIGNSVTAGLTHATGEGVNDNDTTTVNIIGGNSLSSMALGTAGAAAIGVANGGEATGLTVVNASTFAGALTAKFGDDVVDTNLTITGGSGTDNVHGTYTGAAVVKMSGVERFHIESDATGTIDLSNVTGLTTVFVDDDGTAAASTLTDLPTGVGVKFSTGITGSSLVVDMKDKANTDNALTLELTAIITDSNIDIEDVETLTLDVEVASPATDLAGLAMTTAGKTSVLNITGDSTLTISALNADVTTIDASGMTAGGTVVMTGRSQTSAATYTGTDGADTFIMMHKNDVLSGGAASDTLDINYAAILGGLSIDLSSATDVVQSFNGSANAVAQSGFLNVELSGYTGSFGSEITANKGGSTITGTLNTDTITLGAGTDNVVVTSLAENKDIIAGFTNGTDNFDINVLLDSDDGTDVAIGGIIAATHYLAVTIVAADNVFQAAGPGSGKQVIFEMENANEVFSGNFATMSSTALKNAVVTELDSSTDMTTGSVGEVIVIIYDNQATANALLVAIDQDGTNGTLAAGEITVLGVVTGVGADNFVSGDFV